jgi:hypothetical protein
MSAIKDYAMFTPEGNQVVDLVVEIARESKMTWPQVLIALERISNYGKDYSEATDTAVRECVFDALGFTGDFYV